MKSKTLKKKAGLKSAGGRKSVSSMLSDVFRFSRRHSAYAFVATLGVWLPKGQAATLVNLDSTTQALGALNTWPNTGSLGGGFNSAGTVSPNVVSVDGVNGVALVTGAPGAGTDGSHYVGPTAPASVVGANARTIEAWIFNTNSLGEQIVFSYGRRGADGLNNAFGHGTDPAFGAVGMWGAPDIGWGNSAAQVATNRVVNRWTYIVQTFDGTNNSVYVDGRLANTEGRPPTLQINTADVDTASNPLPFRVARQTAADGTVSGAGDENIVIGRIRVQDSAMSAAAIQAQFDAEKGTFNLNDTDGDGMPDWWEARYGLNKNSAADATLDADSDGLNNLNEYLKGTNPTAADTDGDGLSDGAEVNRIDPQTSTPAPTNPLSADSDNDGLSDAVETDTGVFVSASNTGTDPVKGDTDGDIASDGLEVTSGTDPNNASSTPSMARAIELDATGLATGPLTNWVNTGFITGNFSVPTNATVPSVITLDGVKGVGLQSVPAGNNGTHYVGPATIADVTGSHARTVEAWVYDPANAIQDEKIIIAWGSRAFSGGADGADYGLGIGSNNDWGAVPCWGTPDIGWNDQENHGRWTHIAATWDGTTTRLYSDGVQANIESAGINTPLTAPGDGLPFRFRIGRQNGATSSTDIDNTGEGQVTIAKVRVYTNSLDGATIKAQFDSEKGQFGLVDTDGDGLPDWYEVRWGLDKNSAVGANGATGDPDGDSLTNLQEYQLGTAATLADTDADGLSDSAEVNRIDPQTALPAPTNPLVADTDGDGLRDGVETDTGTFVSPVNTGSDPLKVDTDGDTFSDGLEVSQGSNPVNASIIPDPGPRINLVSTNLPAGPVTNWVNSGSFSNGMAFTANLGFGNVQSIQGVTALRLPGTAYYDGPTNPAAANLTGNPVYSIEAWIYNESPGQGEEIILGWGRRGTDGLNNAFGHGTSGDFGAMGHWGARDLGWNGVVNFDRWTHLVYTYDAQTSVQKAWVDGAQVNQETIAGLDIAAVGTGGPAPMRVGRQNAASGAISGTGPAAGLSIAELRVYSRVLGTNEIVSKFNVGKGVYGLGDNDGDGIIDWYERLYPTCLSENNNLDAALDCDADGLNNLEEFQNGTNPTVADTDGDGIPDGEEVHPTVRPFPTSPKDRDTDRDGLDDNVETGTGVYVSPQNTGTTANFADSDGDTYPDATEVAYRIADGITDPNNGSSVPNIVSPVPVVKLDATGIVPGPLSIWTNLSGLPNWNFVAPTGAIASVQYVDGTRGVTLNTTNNYTGHGAPVGITGNASRTVDAWIYNPARTGEETVFAWGRRGGNPDGSNSAFSHGTDAGFGALQFWGGGPDVPWGADATSINTNVIAGKWTYLTYTYDNVTGIRACYKDGVLANSETNGVGVVLSTFAVNNTAGADALPFRVGAQNEADGSLSTAAQPSMTIGKLRVYDLALSAAQIASTYNAERVQFPGQPKITNVQVNPGTGIVSFDWVPAPGHTYEVQRATNAANPSAWSVIATGQSSGSYSDNPAGAPMNFYRLRIEP